MDARLLHRAVMSLCVSRELVSRWSPAELFHLHGGGGVRVNLSIQMWDIINPSAAPVGGGREVLGCLCSGVGLRRSRWCWTGGTMDRSDGGARAALILLRPQNRHYHLMRAQHLHPKGPLQH